jgi:excinuclease ABC subunit C
MKAPARPFVFDVKRYPGAPGCYLMKDGNGRVIYVGKAKDLRKRLSSYFRPTAGGKERRLAARVRDIEVIVVNNETESLILENNLIKRHKPIYNVMLMDESSGYGYLMLTGERYPRCVVYRKHRVNRDLDEDADLTSARRFGPYVSRRYRDALQAFVNEYFGLRVCKKLPKKTCLLYEMGKCSGICEHKVTDAEYAEAIRGAASLLSYHSKDLIAELRKRMVEHAERLEFEKAIKVRDQILVLQATLEKQVVERDIAHDQDVVYFDTSTVMVAHVTGGAISGASLYPLDTSVAEEQARQDFLMSYCCQPMYGTHRGTREQRELIVNRLDDPTATAAKLAETSGQRIKITVPKRGAKRDLLKLCEQNLALNHTLPIHTLQPSSCC